MNKKQKQIWALSILILVLVLVNYSIIDKGLISLFDEDYEYGKVDRIVDGDTIIVGGESVRLLGMNTPERGEEYYAEAKGNLNFLVNTSVKLVFGKDKYDRYNRKLAYVFYDNVNLNLKQVKDGYANPYFPAGKDKYYSSFYSAWEDCTQNLCILSENSCFDCIQLIKLDKFEQELVFENTCAYSCDLTSWAVKDEGRKKYIFPDFTLNSNSEVKIVVREGTNTNKVLYWDREDYVWTSSGDALFLRDIENKLVLWEKY